jgi:F0F1-type ATP synthase membrane subunit b/b'
MEIFTQLGVDESLPYQFAIILIAFILAHFLFLGKLQKVLEVREEQTVKLESSADETIEKVSTMQNEYKTKIDEANRLALKKSTDQKQSITQKYTDQYKQTEKEMNNFVDESRNGFRKEIVENKAGYLAESENLAQSLVKKIIQ